MAQSVANKIQKRYKVLFLISGMHNLVSTISQVGKVSLYLILYGYFKLYFPRSVLSTFTQMATILPEVCQCLIQRQVAYITYASRGIVSRRYTLSRGEARSVAFLEREKNRRRSLAFATSDTQPRYTPSVNARIPSEGLNEV